MARITVENGKFTKGGVTFIFPEALAQRVNGVQFGPYESGDSDRALASQLWDAMTRSVKEQHLHPRLVQHGITAEGLSALPLRDDSDKPRTRTRTRGRTTRSNGQYTLVMELAGLLASKRQRAAKDGLSDEDAGALAALNQQRAALEAVVASNPALKDALAPSFKQIDVQVQRLMAGRVTFTQKEAALLQALDAYLKPEATVEATPEATPEVTVEATVEATPEVTVEATAEAVAEATAEA